MTRCVVTIVILLCAPMVLAQNRDIIVNAGDGFALRGTFFAARLGGPGILLLHPCDADRQVYEMLATMLNTAGYSVLALDFRGAGGSKGGEYTDLDAQREAVVERMPGDVDAALDFLTSQSTVNPRALAVVGGGCAVNQVVQAATRHQEIRTVVLLSGAADAEGEAYVKNSGVPILGIASEEDQDGGAAIRTIIELSTNLDSRVEIFGGAGNAASLLANELDLPAEIVIWFRSVLPTSGYGLPPAIR